MLIDKDLRPWLCASSGRPVITGLLFDKAKKLLIATDGRMLGQFPVTKCEDDTDGAIIPADALKEAFKKKSLLAGGACIVVKDGTVKLLDGRSWPLMNGKYPDWAQVVPHFPEGARTVRLMINPELLAKIYEALGRKGSGAGALLEFAIDADSLDAGFGPIAVSIGDKNGVLMPIRYNSGRHFTPVQAASALEVK